MCRNKYDHCFGCLSYNQLCYSTINAHVWWNPPIPLLIRSMLKTTKKRTSFLIQGTDN